MPCDFCGSKGAAVAPADKSVQICHECIRAIDLTKTPDGVSTHPRSKNDAS